MAMVSAAVGQLLVLRERSNRTMSTEINLLTEPSYKAAQFSSFR